MSQGLRTKLERSVGPMDGDGHRDLPGTGPTPAPLQPSLLQGPCSPITSAPQLGWTGCPLRHSVREMTDRLGHTGRGRAEHRLCPGPLLRFPGVLGWD